MSDPSCSLFVLDHPPLLKTCGFGFVSTHQLGATNTTTFDFELDVKAFTSGTQPGSVTDKLIQGFTNPPPLTGTAVRERFWRTTEPPLKLAATQKIVRTLVLGSTESQLQTLKGAVTATVGGSFAGFSAEVTASVEMGIENQRTFSAESSEEREVTLDGGKAYAFWELVESVSMTFDPWVHGFVLLVPDTMAGASVVAVFQDEATFDELPKE